VDCTKDDCKNELELLKKIARFLSDIDKQAESKSIVLMINDFIIQCKDRDVAGGDLHMILKKYLRQLGECFVQEKTINYSKISFSNEHIHLGGTTEALNVSPVEQRPRANSLERNSRIFFAILEERVNEYADSIKVAEIRKKTFSNSLHQLLPKIPNESLKT